MARRCDNNLKNLLQDFAKLVITFLDAVQQMDKAYPMEGSLFNPLYGIREVNNESSALSRMPYTLNVSSVIVNYFFTDGKSQTRSRKFIFSVKSLEHTEYFIRIFFVKTYAVIFKC